MTVFFFLPQSNTWCIARPVADVGRIQKDIDMLCTELDCSIIKPGGSCYIPDTVPDHASVLYNLYYKQHGADRNACDFGGDAMVVTSNPCKLQSTHTQKNEKEVKL